MEFYFLISYTSDIPVTGVNIFCLKKLCTNVLFCFVGHILHVLLIILICWTVELNVTKLHFIQRTL